MSVDKRASGAYLVRWRPVPGGPQQTKTFRGKGAYRAAHDFDAAIHADLARGDYVDPAAGTVTFRAYAEEWRTLRPHRVNTADRVESQFRLHVYPVLGDRPLGKVRPSHVDALVRRLEGKLAPSTVGVVYVNVAAVFRAAVRDRVIARTPCVDVDFASSSTSRVRVLSAGQVAAIAGAVTPRFRALVVTAAGTGLRPGELAALNVANVDFLRRTVTVDPDVGNRVRAAGGGMVDGPPKTPEGARTVPLPQTVVDAIAAHIAAYGLGDGGRVFTAPTGAPVSKTTFAHHWRQACDAVGVDPAFDPHDCRHFYASTLIAAGLSVKVVQARLGHKSAMTTLDTYGHLWPDDDDATRDAVDAALELELDQRAAGG